MSTMPGPVGLIEVMRRQREAIVQQMRLDPANVLIGVRSHHELERRSESLRFGGDSSSVIVPLTSLDGKDILPTDGVAYRPTVGNEPECWCRPVDKSQASGPYERVWRAFQKQFYNSDYNSERNPSRWAIDHLYPETAAAREGFIYVRLLPLDAVANSAIGAAVEAFMARQAASSTKIAHDLTYLTLAKLSGWRGKLENPVEWRTVYQMIEHIVTNGMSPEPGMHSGAYLFAFNVELTWRNIRKRQRKPRNDDTIEVEYLAEQMRNAGYDAPWMRQSRGRWR